MKNNKTLRKSIIKSLITGQASEHCLTDLSSFELADIIRKEQSYLLSKKILKKQKNDNRLTYKNGKYTVLENDILSDVDEEIIKQLPVNWTILTQKELFWLENGVKTSGEELPLLDAKFLRTRANPEYVKSGVVVGPEDKIILVDGENSGELFIPHCRGYLGSTFKILRFTDKMEYGFLVLILKASQERYRSNKTGIAIPHLNKTLFRNDLAFIPPINEQKIIVKKYKMLEPLIDEYEALERERESISM